MTESTRLSREAEFWDEAVDPLETRLAHFHRGPEPNTRLMLEAVRPRPGLKVLDFACGTGLTSCWLAAHGAEVTGVDLSPASIEAARQLAEQVGVDVDFVAADVESLPLPPGGFDAVVGRYALHHLDISRMAPVLAGCLRPGGRGAFVETMGLNPVLRLARDHLVGRLGVARYGTEDEHPLRQPDLAELSRSFAAVVLTQAEYRFFTLIDRNALHGRWPSATKGVRAIDRALAQVPRLRRWSFHQVVLVQKAPVDVGSLVQDASDSPKIFARGGDEGQVHLWP